MALDPGEQIRQLLAAALRARSAGDFAAARRLYLQILEFDSAHHAALHDLGVIAAISGQLGQAVQWYEQALRAQPAAADSHSNLGVVLKELGEVDRAIGHLTEAIRLRPEYAQAHNNLGTALLAQNDLTGALAHFRRATELKPEDAVAWANTGRVLLQLHGADAALGPLQSAVALAPNLVDARSALGAALFALGRYPEAIAQLEQALKAGPGRIEILADLVHARQHTCEWAGLGEHAATIRRHVVTAGHSKVTPFFFMMLPGSTASEQKLCAEKYAREQFGWAIRRRPSLGFAFERRPKHKLRIGYFTAHFHDHATMHSLAGVLELHDRARFEIVGLSHGPESSDAMRKRALAALDEFVDLRTMTDENAAHAIHARGIDILIDAKGYSRAARPAIVALRPAPVQAGYLVYPGTCGGDFLDYYIADRHVVPPGNARAYSERIKYLPDIYLCNDSARPQIAPPARSACGLPENGFVFCCFNQTYKMTPAVFDVWCRLLDAVPGSVLWLWASNPYAPDNLRREAQARRVDPRRLVFAQTLRPAEQHRARISLADLFLDTLTCTAHTTASDALWAGVPLVTCTGDTFTQRAAGSILRAMGLPELVTTTLSDYEALALKLAREPDSLGALRRRVADNRATSPLFDTAKQTRALESVYEEIWREYVEGGPGHVAP